MEYELKGAETSRALTSLSCSCSTYISMQIVCHHMCYLLTRLQMKSMQCVEHLKFWREYVGYKNKNINDHRTTNTYKVRKEVRLKSFMEIITNKHKARVQKVAKELGIKEVRVKRIGERVSSGEEEEFAKLNKIVEKRDDEKRKKNREAKKLLRQNSIGEVGKPKKRDKKKK